MALSQRQLSMTERSRPATTATLGSTRPNTSVSAATQRSRTASRGKMRRFMSDESDWNMLPHKQRTSLLSAQEARSASSRARVDELQMILHDLQMSND